MTKEENRTMKPILFNTDMVRAILSGQKTVTRRVVKPHYRDDECSFQIVTRKFDGEFVRVEITDENEFPTREMQPPCKPGDTLYVRETWRNQPLKWTRDSGYSDYELQYRADYTDEENDCYGRCGGVAPWKWRPSIHMPKEAARIFLRVTDVRVERLREIVNDPPGPNNQVVCEGFRYGSDFIATWENTIKPAERALYGWDANPWVWVIEFERISREEAIT